MGNKSKILLLNLLIAAGAVITYSPGLLGLYPNDPSILRAGLSILLGIGFAAGLVGGNYHLLKEPQRISISGEITLQQVEGILKAYYRSPYFGDLAKTIVEQMRRIDNSTARAIAAVLNRFQEGSMTANRYLGIVQSAGAAAMDNIRTAAVRIQMFDDEEFKRLKRYRNDNIPDEIQEQQLTLYNKNIAHVRGAIAANEKLILKLDTLTLEISDFTSESQTSSDQILGEITQLTEELKYYK